MIDLLTIAREQVFSDLVSDRSKLIVAMYNEIESLKNKNKQLEEELKKHNEDTE